MRHPDWLIVRRAEATMGDQRFAMRQPFGFDKELVESGMRTVGPVRRECELEVAGELQPAHLREVLTSVTRRTSASSSAEMAISVIVSHGPLLRRNSALSGVKLHV